MATYAKRKRVQREVLQDFSLPTGNQYIVKIVAARGNNLHEVIDQHGETYLVSMPIKFRKNIWVKWDMYVVVEPIPEGKKVRAEITKILTEEHIEYYKSQGIWPKEFVLKEKKNNDDDNEEMKKGTESDENTDSDSDLFVNPNRLKPRWNCGTVESDSSDSD